MVRAMRSISWAILVLAACGNPPPATPRYESDGHAGRCLPVVGNCDCSYTCGLSLGPAENGGARVQTGDGEVVEATLERWCQGGDCRDAFVRPLPCGGECVPTRLFDSCAMRNDACVQSPRDALHSAAEDWLGEIAGRQEAHRAEFGEYFPMEAQIQSWAPAVLPQGATWQNPGRWTELQFRDGEPLPFQFRVWSGKPGMDPPIVPPARGSADGERYWSSRTGDHDFWWVVRARGNADGTPVIFQRTSWDDRVVSVEPL